MPGFTFETAPRLLCEVGASAKLGALSKDAGISRPLVVTDKGLLDAGVIAKALRSLSEAGCQATVFCDVQADPPEVCVLDAARVARSANVDGVIGIGGGSCMDTAKLVAVLAVSDQPLAELYGSEHAKGPRLPLIQVPTTAGTGSEVTSIAVVTTAIGQKVSVDSRLLLPDLAVLDATLTVGLSPRMTAMTGIEAMVHAIEAYSGKARKSPVSDGLALKALELLAGSIRAAVTDGQDLGARGAMLQGSLMAGMAFSNSPAGAVQALANPIGGLFQVPHGLGNALVLGPVLSFNIEAAEAHYAELGWVVSPETRHASTQEAADAFVRFMQDLVADLPIEQCLGDVGIRRQDIDRLATDALKIQRLLANNPREVRHEDAVALYLAAL